MPIFIGIMPEKAKVWIRGKVLLFLKKFYCIWRVKLKKGVVKLPQYLLIHQVMALVHAQFLVDLLGSVVGFVYV